MTTKQLNVEAGSVHYKARSLQRFLLLLTMGGALFLSFAIDLATGPANYPLSDVIATLLDPWSATDQLRVVIWDIRMPIALMALTVGAALSTAGAQMQTILANPLASPFTLGISAAAGFGAALALVLGVALLPAFVDFIIPLNAFVMAMGTALIIHFFSRLRGVTVETIVCSVSHWSLHSTRFWHFCNIWQVNRPLQPLCSGPWDRWSRRPGPKWP